MLIFIQISRNWKQIIIFFYHHKVVNTVGSSGLIVSEFSQEFRAARRVGLLRSSLRYQCTATVFAFSSIAKYKLSTVRAAHMSFRRGLVNQYNFVLIVENQNKNDAQQW